MHQVIEVDRDKNIVWQYGITDSAGSGYKQLNGPVRANRLSNGNTLIADHVNRRIIEVSRDKQIVWQTTISYYPYDARKLDNGNVLIADQYNDRIIEVTTGNNSIRWEYGGLSNPNGAYRMDNGNTLIADTGNNRVIEINYAKSLIWEYKGLNSPVSAIELSNGNIFISDNGNHRVMEVNRDKVILWQYGETGVAGYSQQHLNSPSGCEEVLLPTVGCVIGTITRVSDGGVLSGVTIMAVQDGVIKGTTATSADGRYILDLSPGTYILKASITGYDSQTKEGIGIIVGKSNKMDFTLIDMLQYTPVYLPSLESPTNYFYPVGVYPVRIKILDPEYPLDPSSLRVYYRINDNTTWNSVSMNSTGADYEYSALIPQQPAGTRVYYYIEGKNTGGDIITSPAKTPTSKPYQFKVVALNIVSTTPRDNAANVGVAGNIKAVFSNPMNQTTVGSQTIRVMIGTAAVDGVYSCQDKAVIFEPTERFREETGYNVIVTTQVQDTASNTIPTEYSFKFYTTLLGNLDEYSRVDGRDLIILGGAFGSTPQDTNWNKLADFNKEADSRDRIDSRDLSALASRFGRSTLLSAPKLVAAHSQSANAVEKATIKLEISNTLQPISINQELTIRVLIDNACSIYSCGFDLVFDADQFEVIGVKEGGFLKQDGADTSFMDVIKQGRVIIGASRLGEDVDGINGSGVLAEVILRAKQDQTEVNINLQKVLIEDSNLKLLGAEIINLYTPQTNLSPRAKAFCYPNPAKDRITFRFDLPKAGDVGIEIYNIAGELVKQIEKKGLSQGSNQEISWQPIEVASGIYIYKFVVKYNDGGEERVVKKLGVVR